MVIAQKVGASVLKHSCSYEGSTGRNAAHCKMVWGGMAWLAAWARCCANNPSTDVGRIIVHVGTLETGRHTFFA